MRMIILKCCMLLPVGLAQNPDEVLLARERGMANQEFRAPRAAGVQKVAGRTKSVILGLTVWQLRPPAPTDRERVLEHPFEDGSNPPLMAERLEDARRLQEGGKIRITVEPSREGQLYVISRERYSDGSFGGPRLVFPSVRIRGGSARAVPGEPIEIPEGTNRVPYLRLRKSRPDHTDEQLVLILAPAPIPGLIVTSGVLRLDPEQVTRWIEKWGANVQMLDDPERRGAPMSAAEFRAAKHSERLRPQDAVPQLMFRKTVGTDQPVLATYFLKLDR